MNKWILGMLVLALCAGPASAGSASLFGSSYSPDSTDTGEGFGAEFEFGEGRAQFQMRLSLYQDLLTDATPERYLIEAMPFDLGVNWHFGAGKTVEPYVGTGVSYTDFDFSVDVTRTGGLPRGANIDGEFGYYAQVGLDFAINDTWGVNAEAVFRSMEAEVESDDVGFPLDQKVDMSGVALNIGIGVRW